MCHERFLRQPHREAEEGHKLWEDFERTRPVAEPEPPSEVTEAEHADARDEVSAPER